jgi:regulator of replication initiation timing
MKEEGAMTTLETLGCRQYMAEDELFRAGARLNERLHELERSVNAFREDVHRVVCESGRMPIEMKALEILAKLRTVVQDAAPATLLAETKQVVTLKARVEGYEREIAEMLRACHEHPADTGPDGGGPAKATAAA